MMRDCSQNVLRDRAVQNRSEHESHGAANKGNREERATAILPKLRNSMKAACAACAMQGRVYSLGMGVVLVMSPKSSSSIYHLKWWRELREWLHCTLQPSRLQGCHAEKELLSCGSTSSWAHA